MLTAEVVEQVLTPKTRAGAVHTYGNACDMELCRSREILVIKDAAGSFGTCCGAR